MYTQKYLQIGTTDQKVVDLNPVGVTTKKASMESLLSD